MSTANPQDFVEPRATARTSVHPIRQLLVHAGSLKITCTLFVLGMFIIFAGSLAQSRRDVWQVVNQYFRVYVAEIEVRDFFPPSMFPQLLDFDWEGRLGIFASFPFPGGWLIGWLLLGNLIAAHVAKIRIQAKGLQLWFGILAVAVGAMLLALIVVTGNQQTGVEQGNTLLSPSQIWGLLLAVMVTSVVALGGAAFLGNTRTRAERWVLLGIAAAIVALLTYFAIFGQVNLSSMRILWQLMKACVCSFVLLIGCQLLFKKRSGIVLLHLGVATLMISELVVGLYGHESLMMIVEGESATFARDIREVELAIVSTDDGKDSVIAIPESQLLDSRASQDAAAIISLKDYGLPFDLRVTEFYRNSQLRSAEPGDTLTESGTGSFAVPVRLDPVDGMNDESDMSAAYVEIIDQNTGDKLQTILTSLSASESRSAVLPERITVDEKPYDITLRFRRNYRPFNVELIDVTRETYVGTATPRNFQSTVLITDNESGRSEEFTLWMNNPLRYNGETFYQSGYHPLPSGGEATTLQLVRNSGWMLPYIGCVIVAFGMFAQFWLTLRRFLARSAQQRTNDSPRAGDNTSLAAKFIPIGVAVLCIAWLGSKVRAPAPPKDAMDLYEFAKLPMAGGGRTQPVDSWARSQLMLTSHKSTFKGELTAAELDAERETLLDTITSRWPDVDFQSLATFNGEYEDWIEELQSLTSSSQEAVEARIRDAMTARMSAARWFLDMIARPDRAVRHRVVRIDNDQVLSLLGLEQREGLVYSPAEIQQNIQNLQQIDKDARQLMEANQDNRLEATQRRVMALFNTIRRLDTMQQVFRPAQEDDLLPSLVEAWRILNRLEGAPVPMGIVTGIEDDQRAWETVRAGSLLKSCRDQMVEKGIRTSSDLESWFTNDLAKETLLSSLEGSYELLQEVAKEQAAGKPVEPAAANQLADKLLSGDLKDEFNDGYNRQILRLISAADPTQPISTVVDSLTDDHMRKLASEKITRDLFAIFQTLESDSTDKRLNTVRTRIQQLQQDKDTSLLGITMNQELFTIMQDDLSKRAKRLLYPSSDAPEFVASSDGMLGALEAWGTGDVEKFNRSVSQYRSFLESSEVAHVDNSVVTLETAFNRFDPFGKAIYLYLTAMLLSFIGWILWPRTLRNTAIAMILVALVVHTIALVLRMQISGRPPVTSLYSSAIFIGWAMVAASLIIERLVGHGIGNIVGASVGAATLVIAHYLARDEGDTFSVMQAVLDTTFWLATHVVCITLGYGATFLAGFLGLCYVVMSIRNTRTGVTGESSDRGTADLAFLDKVVYGVLCFALFFSLVGTVLGGLWADDSWGRFWGWDPKENGALIIVMWNALILHARWDKMVRSYGTAVLAMVGNVVTAWSWFGVNELRAGLHSYGFTEGRMGMLMGFIGIQLLIVLIAAFIRPQRHDATV
jgi:cytochrome c-type biogenesis protein CcsB